jgi:hypothetical protein
MGDEEFGVIVIASQETRRAADQVEGVENQLRAAMRAALDHWLLTNEDIQIKAAIAGVLMICNEEDKARITRELDFWTALSAAISGIPVDMAQVLAGQEGYEPIGLRRLWEEVKESDA